METAVMATLEELKSGSYGVEKISGPIKAPRGR